MSTVGEAPDACDPEPDPPSRPDAVGDDTLTVSGFCALVEGAVERAFPDEVWIQGAISGLTRSGNGHVYFDLVDPAAEMGRSTAAVLPVALFASTRHLVNRILRKSGGVRMHDGIEIRIRGRVAYYPPQGRVQLVMSLIDPAFTLGRMVAAREELLDKLAREGLLERNQEIEFPILPLRVALVTSDGSAAYGDFVDELSGSGLPFRVTLIDSRVQGLDAVPSVTAAIRTADRLDVDVLVVIRGGGARTDLVAFDHERVARAIAHCRHPVIVGVGHEIDQSVADEVANVSAKTPTAAAVLLVDQVGRYAERVTVGAERLASLTTLHLGGAHQHLGSSVHRLVAATRRVTERQAVEVDHLERRLARAPGRAAELADGRLTTASARLSALDPALALQRGWTITTDGSGRVIRSISDVSPGMRLVTTTMDGTIDSTVDGTDGAAAGDVAGDVAGDTA